MKTNRKYMTKMNYAVVLHYYLFIYASNSLAAIPAAYATLTKP